MEIIQYALVSLSIICSLITVGLVIATDLNLRKMKKIRKKIRTPPDNQKQ